MSNENKCNKEQGFCSTLRDFTQSQHRSKGLSWVVILPNLNELLKRPQFSVEEEAKTIGVVYKRNAGDNGIMLNYCPFCGTDLQQFRKR
jgi:hypothetical protein